MCRLADLPRSRTLCRKFRQACWRLSPLFHEGAQNFRVINFDHVGFSTVGCGSCRRDKRDDISSRPLRDWQETQVSKARPGPPACHAASSLCCPGDGKKSGRRQLVWCFPGCQNCSIKGTHLAHPAHADFCSPQAPRSAQSCCGRPDPSLSHYGLDSPSHQAAKP
jgi:hypothetical protein